MAGQIGGDPLAAVGRMHDDANRRHVGAEVVLRQHGEVAHDVVAGRREVATLAARLGGIHPRVEHVRSQHIGVDERAVDDGERFEECADATLVGRLEGDDLGLPAHGVSICDSIHDAIAGMWWRCAVRPTTSPT